MQAHRIQLRNKNEAQRLKYYVCLQCMLWSWYLSDDTQFYVIGAIILIVAVR